MNRRMPHRSTHAALPVLLAAGAILLFPDPASAAAAGGEESVWATVARLFNFAILAGTLVYFLKSPLMGYLASRGTQIRQDLVTAADTRRTASAQLAAIEQKLAALPAELEALKQQGAEDVRAERVRMAERAAAERERLIDQTRREIDMRLRVARRELTELGAQLAMQIAEQRIRQTITPQDQLRLIDRYAAQMQQEVR